MTPSVSPNESEKGETTMTTFNRSNIQAPNVRAFLAKSGLDWEVRAERLVLAADTSTCDSLDDCREVPARAIVRTDTGAILGTVGMEYEPCQNWQQLSVGEQLIEAGVGAFDRAGSFRGGRKVWMQVNLGVGGEVLPGDEVVHRLLISSSHDGSMALKVQDTLRRITCENSLMSARSASEGITLRHTASIHDRLQQVGKVVADARGRFADAMTQWRGLSRVSMSETRMREYIKSVFTQRKAAATPMVAPAKSSIVVEDRTTGDAGGERVADKVMELVESGAGTNIPGVRGTVWGAYNAVTEYLTHLRGNNEDTRMDSLWFGNGAQLNQKALDMAIAIAR